MGKWSRCKDLSDFDKSKTVNVNWVSPQQQVLWGAPSMQCLVKAINRQPTERGWLVNQRQCHERPRLTDARGDRRLAGLIWSPRRSTRCWKRQCWLGQKDARIHDTSHLAPIRVPMIFPAQLHWSCELWPMFCLKLWVLHYCGCFFHMYCLIKHCCRPSASYSLFPFQQDNAHCKQEWLEEHDKVYSIWSRIYGMSWRN